MGGIIGQKNQACGFRFYRGSIGGYPVSGQGIESTSRRKPDAVGIPACIVAGNVVVA